VAAARHEGFQHVVRVSSMLRAWLNATRWLSDEVSTWSLAFVCVADRTYVINSGQ